MEEVTFELARDTVVMVNAADMRDVPAMIVEVGDCSFAVRTLDDDGRWVVARYGFARFGVREIGGAWGESDYLRALIDNRLLTEGQSARITDDDLLKRAIETHGLDGKAKIACIARIDDAHCLRTLTLAEIKLLSCMSGDAHPDVRAVLCAMIARVGTGDRELQEAYTDILMRSSKGGSEIDEALIACLDHEHLMHIAQSHPDKKMRLQAVGRIENQETLRWMVEKHWCEATREAALCGIGDIAYLIPGNDPETWPMKWLDRRCGPEIIERHVTDHETLLMLWKMGQWSVKHTVIGKLQNYRFVWLQARDGTGSDLAHIIRYMKQEDVSDMAMTEGDERRFNVLLAAIDEPRVRLAVVVRRLLGESMVPIDTGHIGLIAVERITDGAAIKWALDTLDGMEPHLRTDAVITLEKWLKDHMNKLTR